MNISFEVQPLISDRMTGIGFCEAGLISALAEKYPDNQYFFEYFTIRNPEVKLERLKPYLKENCKVNTSHFSGFVYRALMNFLPLPYKMFFGKKSEVTHFFNYIVPPFVNGKKVVTVHDMVYKSFPETVRARTKKLLDTGLNKSMKRADRIVTDSEFSKREIIKYFPQFEKKIRVVPCGVDIEKFKPLTDKKPIKFVKEEFGIEGDYFLYIGTIEPRKNLERLIEAYSKLHDELGDDTPKLVLAGGNGWLYDSIFEKVTQLNLSKNVIFTQYVPDNYIVPLLNGAMAFVFPSIYEGFGMPPLEAMACGVPVLTSTEASLPEVVGDCAVTVDAFSVDDIAGGLKRLYENENMRIQLSQKGYQRAQEFTWANAAEKLYEVYEEVLAE